MDVKAGRWRIASGRDKRLFGVVGDVRCFTAKEDGDRPDSAE
jgi:hypothetical protein